MCVCVRVSGIVARQLSLRLHAAGNGVALQSPARRASASTPLSTSSSGGLLAGGGSGEPCEATAVDSLGRGPLVHVPHTLSASFCQQLIGPLRAQVTTNPCPLSTPFLLLDCRARGRAVYILQPYSPTRSLILPPQRGRNWLQLAGTRAWAAAVRKLNNALVDQQTPG